MSLAPIELRRVTLDWSSTYILGVVNVTPDSFSDGGQFAGVDEAVIYGLRLVEEGAAIVDVGGESTRPVGAAAVTAAEEIERVVPVVRGLVAGGATVSIDTTKAEVAEASVRAGAELVNDISGGLFDPAMAVTVAGLGAAFVCGHVRGASIAEVHASGADPPSFEELQLELAARIAALPLSLRKRTVVDPCLGFGKRTPQNIELTRRAGELGTSLGCPVLVGPSRKRFLGELTGAAVDDRDGATVGACLAAVASGVHMLRVHNVKLLSHALLMYERIRWDRRRPLPGGDS